MTRLPLTAALLALAPLAAARAQQAGEPGTPYANMNHLAPIGVRTDRYLPVLDAAKGPPVDPARGYRTEDLGGGAYMVTDNGYNSMFVVYETGVVVVDAPPSYAAHLLAAIREVTDKPVTHLIYSHSHADHIGGTLALGKVPVIIAQEETKRLLVEAHDPNRPLPTLTFKDRYTLKAGSKTIQLSYPGYGHSPGNILIHVPSARVLMVIDTVFPGWMPWRRLALAQDITGLFRIMQEIDGLDFGKLVGGHVERWGTKADVRQQLEFMNDLKAAAATALKTTRPGEELDSADKANPWAIFDNYIDRVVVQCMNTLEPKWRDRLGGYDAFIWDQCYAMEQSLRID
ncbi:MBL fold metallo-hydrolase [Sphingomonas sp. Sphisp140]|uniref:MBL fold metallo-hydrolase n=1 Tax=unclassified Sphingomonas TaxID=196159 RepID=UPI0039AEB4F2